MRVYNVINRQTENSIDTNKYTGRPVPGLFVKLYGKTISQKIKLLRSLWSGRMMQNIGITGNKTGTGSRGKKLKVYTGRNVTGKLKASVQSHDISKYEKSSWRKLLQNYCRKY